MREPERDDPNAFYGPEDLRTRKDDQGRYVVEHWSGERWVAVGYIRTGGRNFVDAPPHTRP